MNRNLSASSYQALSVRLAWALLLTPLLLACSGKVGDGDDKEATAIGGRDTSGDGDGDTSGDGDGDGDGGTSGDGDGDGGTSGDGDGDGDGGSSVEAKNGELDLLFVVDNSARMAVKQEILSQAVPLFLEGLVQGSCRNEQGEPAAVDEAGDCPTGYTQESVGYDDVHIGVVTTSLGNHGSGLCKGDDVERNDDDHGHLLPSVRSDMADPDGTQFLSWSGGDELQQAALVADFQEHILGAGGVGCGYEATLESWYRFLVDPQPPMDIVLNSSTGRAEMASDDAGNLLVDGILLAQREAFLRPESTVAIVTLTDENDCSAMDGGAYYNNASYGYLIPKWSKTDVDGVDTGVFYTLPIATPICEANPNDVCCFSCLQGFSPPDNCDASACLLDSQTVPPNLPQEEDRPNVACHDVKRRFGVDLLYPIERYVDALSQSEIVEARTGTRVSNPLLRGAGAQAGRNRPKGRIFFGGIVGVPWQDLASDESLTSPDLLQFRSSTELHSSDLIVEGAGVSRWEVILGDPGKKMSEKECEGANPAPLCGVSPVAPLDPFMIASIAPRTVGLMNPITGDAIVGAESLNPLANGINGHEADHTVIGDKYADSGPLNDDLQYACIFPRANPMVDCTVEDLPCDCGDEPLRNRPICQAPEGGAAGNTQYFSKAYPSIRILQVLRAFGENSLVGSICPKITSGDPADLNYGYNPFFQQLLSRLAE